MGTLHGGMLLPAPASAQRSVAHVHRQLARHRVRQHDRRAAVSGDRRDGRRGAARQRAACSEGVVARQRADRRHHGLHCGASHRRDESAAGVACRDLRVAPRCYRVDRIGSAWHGGRIRRPATCFVACRSIALAAAVYECACRACNGTTSPDAEWLACGPAWPAALVLAFGSAFDPMLYVLLVPLLAMALIASVIRRSWVGVRRVFIVLAVPPALLMPWSARLWHHPALLVLGVGQPSAGLASQAVTGDRHAAAAPGRCVAATDLAV